jgi:hypothetical protein
MGCAVRRTEGYFSQGSSTESTKVDSNHILRRQKNAAWGESGQGPYCDFLTLGENDAVVAIVLLQLVNGACRLSTFVVI